VQETIEMAQVDQSIATNSMQKAEKEFGILNQQLAQLAALEKTLSEQAYAAARAEFHTPGHEHGRAGAAVDRAVAGGDDAGAARHAGRHRRDLGVVRELAAGRLASASASDRGRDEIADTSRALDHTIAKLNLTLRSVLDRCARSTRPRRKSPAATWTCRPAPKCRPARSSRPPARWKR
jgi:hypothetical protein